MVAGEEIRDTSGAMTTLRYCRSLFMAGAGLFAVSMRGQVMVTGLTQLGTLGGSFSGGHGMNTAGDSVGYSQNGGGVTSAFLYSGGVMTDLGTLGGAYSLAYAVNASDQVVGYSQNGSGLYHAFSYSGGVAAFLLRESGHATFSEIPPP